MIFITHKVGVTLFTLGLVLVPSPSYTGVETFGPVSAFMDDPHTPLFLGMLVGSSICSGLFVVPLQAMAQRRSQPEIRARLMSAGSVLLNLFVNVTTFGLIGLAAMALSHKTPFFIIIIGSTLVSVYALYRSVKLVEREQPGVN